MSLNLGRLSSSGFGEISFICSGMEASLGNLMEYRLFESLFSESLEWLLQSKQMPDPELHRERSSSVGSASCQTLLRLASACFGRVRPGSAAAARRARPQQRPLRLLKPGSSRHPSTHSEAAHPLPLCRSGANAFVAFLMLLVELSLIKLQCMHFKWYSVLRNVKSSAARVPCEALGGRGRPPLSCSLGLSTGGGGGGGCDGVALVVHVRAQPVHLHVVHPGAVLGEALLAELAPEGPLLVVHEQVQEQRRPPRERGVAHLAAQRRVQPVHVHVHAEVLAPAEPRMADVALVAARHLSTSSRYLHVTGRHECYICHARFSRSKYLGMHMHVHRLDAPLRCKVCNPTFARRAPLLLHLLVHDEERPSVRVLPAALRRAPRLAAARAFKKDQKSIGPTATTGSGMAALAWVRC
ncbi:Uncharacterized protein GBIM_20336 [Gryllus bimaculatus]|nr:Uncharacterized protein GBIM_20336 [Gryllus bimaculatus]